MEKASFHINIFPIWRFFVTSVAAISNSLDNPFTIANRIGKDTNSLGSMVTSNIDSKLFNI